MTGGFLVISPKLRLTLVDTYAMVSTGLEDHSPYSYVAVGLGVFLLLVIILNRGSAGR